MAVVRLHLTLIEMAGGTKELVLEAGRSPLPLPELLAEIGVPEEEVGIIVRNRRMDRINCLIGAEDLVELFPILSGG
ncbi:MAG: hypothetical protein NT047_17970 [Deltaproteobacteria bacterium]|nr:hypothetical protein [Deltaproteobacteria bacterium]